MNFVLAAGGSGGHMIPALRVAEVLRLRGHFVRLMGSSFWAISDGDSEDFFNHGAVGWADKRGVSKIWALMKMGRAVLKCREELRALRPKGVCGFGGFGAFPVVYAACGLGIPSMIHEQNVIPGQANRWLLTRVNQVALSFDGVDQWVPPNKAVVTGCPSHYNGHPVDLNAAYEFFGFSAKRRTVLVLGGSQGSRALNEIVPQALVALDASFDLQVIHCAGQLGIDVVKDVYDLSALQTRIFSFLKEMDKAFTIADLVISRAGAVSVSEIRAYNKTAILVPYPYAQSHQLANARWLESQGLAQICLEQDLTCEQLRVLIGERLSAQSVSSIVESQQDLVLPENKIANILEGLTRVDK